MKRNALLPAILCLHFAVNMCTVQARTERYGVLEHDERWTAEESPYFITDDLLIPPDVRLVVTPGTSILVGKPLAYGSRFAQIDHLDSFTVAIRVEGELRCVGRSENRISIAADRGDSLRCYWYGIVIDTKYDEAIEMAFCDVADACNGIVVRNGAPLIRNCVSEFNNVGMLCIDNSRPKIYNCVLSHNFTVGLRIKQANPALSGNIIAFNRGTGVWSDGISHVAFSYNCVFGNGEGNFVDCAPEFGMPKLVNKNKDSTDQFHNLCTDPIFAGSPADSTAVEYDVYLQTDRSRITDTTLARVLHDTLTDSSAIKRRTGTYKRYTLSPYSPCINAGKPGKAFKDMDGSRNDIGIYGGQEFASFAKD